ncbi:MAG: lipid A biosynthesis lauroyl acyltransferase, partial [Hyphomicrobiales bacterium]|nr:lipid A biosynthesis lauroyl acyltransferase [Hyphomicrobiales bacterium]
MADDRPLARRLRHGAEAAGFSLASALFRLLGPDLASDVGGWIGRVLLRRLPVTARARENLRTAFPELAPPEVERIVRGMWDNLGRVGAEYPHLASLADAEPPRVEVIGREHIEAALAKGRGLVFAAGHFANWEAIAAAAKRIGV